MKQADQLAIAAIAIIAALVYVAKRQEPATIVIPPGEPLKNPDRLTVYPQGS